MEVEEPETEGVREIDRKSERKGERERMHTMLSTIAHYCSLQSLSHLDHNIRVSLETWKL